MESSALCSFEDILSHLLYFKGKSVRPTAWRVDLEIGRDIQIEVVGYKLVCRIIFIYPFWFVKVRIEAEQLTPL